MSQYSCSRSGRRTRGPSLMSSSKAMRFRESQFASFGNRRYNFFTGSFAGKTVLFLQCLPQREIDAGAAGEGMLAVCQRRDAVIGEARGAAPNGDIAAFH